MGTGLDITLSTAFRLLCTGDLTMPRRSRRNVAARFFHVINRTARKTPIFLRPKDYEAFLEILKEGLDRHPVRLLSYCVLANHWHLVVGPKCIPQLSQLMHWVTSTHAVRWRRRHQTVGEGPVYQGRFKAQPIDETAHLVRVCRYVERNALRAGLVRRAQDWPWCSLAERRLSTGRLPLVATPFLASDAWVDYVNAALTPEEQAEACPPCRKQARPPQTTRPRSQAGSPAA